MIIEAILESIVIKIMTHVCVWDESGICRVVIIERFLLSLVRWRNCFIIFTWEDVDCVIVKIWGIIDGSSRAVPIHSIIGSLEVIVSIESDTSTSKCLTFDGWRENCSELMSTPRTTRVSEDSDCSRINIQCVQWLLWVLTPSFNRWNSSEQSC